MCYFFYLFYFFFFGFMCLLLWYVFAGTLVVVERILVWGDAYTLKVNGHRSFPPKLYEYYDGHTAIVMPQTTGNVNAWHRSLIDARPVYRRYGICITYTIGDNMASGITG